MTSPRWSEPGQVPIAAAMAAAMQAAWGVPREGAERRIDVFMRVLRVQVGEEVFARIEYMAIDVFQLQPEPPPGWEDVPEWALFKICPKCRSLRMTPFTAPQNARTKLQVLRDPQWLAAALERFGSARAVARSLECSDANVVRWCEVHGLTTPKTMRQEETEAIISRMHGEGEAPGAIAKHLSQRLGRRFNALEVRRTLSRLGLASNKKQVYCEREWWRVRLEDRGMTKSDCCREAGITAHNGTYYINKFGFQAITERNNRKGKPKRWPMLYDAAQLRDLLRRNGDNYEAAARSIGCTSSSLVARQARKLLGWGKRHENKVPHGTPAWWEARLKQPNATTYEIADELGITEKTVRERLRIFGLLDVGLRNNLAAERTARSERKVA